MQNYPRIDVITESREHLFALMHYLMLSLDADFLNDPKNPVMIFLEGTQNSGKSIFPDATAECLLGDEIETFSHYDLGSLADKRQINKAGTSSLLKKPRFGRRFVLWVFRFFRLVRGYFSVLKSQLSRCRQQFRDADEVVADEIEHEVPGDILRAPEFGFAHRSVQFAPAEHALDHLAFCL